MPVYRDDFLEGVAGADVKLVSLIDDFLAREVPDGGYAVLIGSDGTLLALPVAGEADWNIEELAEYTYQDAILQDTFKPDDFNLHNQPGMESLAHALESAPTGSAELDINGSPRIVSWATIPETGWKLLSVVQTANIQAAAEAMIQRIMMIGSIMLISLILAYAVYFVFLFRKAHKTSIRIASPLIKISNMARRIGRGDYDQEVPEIPVVELNNTAAIVAETGRQLGESTQSLLDIQEILRKSEQDIRALIHAVEDMILVVDKNGSVQHVWRKEDESDHPKPIDESPHLAAYFPTDVVERILRHTRSVLTTGSTSAVEYKDGDGPDARWYQVRISPVDPALQTAVLSLRDITDRIHTEQAAMQAKEEAESASNAKSRFLSSMSHELRTPLNAVLGYAQLLSFSDEGVQDEDARHSVQEIIRAGRHLLNLIDRILELTKTESDRNPIVLEAVRVDEIMKEVVDLIRPMADKRNIRITMEPGAYCSSTVQADPTRVRQVLINLLTNAIKYNRPGGTVDIYCNRDDTRIRFNIVDTGYGIPEAETEQIFQPFYRLPYPEGTPEGTGIGLAISRQLVEDMGGRIGVVSEEGAGSRFWFSLPQTKTEDE